jgi:hypothetical protein
MSIGAAKRPKCLKARSMKHLSIFFFLKLVWPDKDNSCTRTAVSWEYQTKGEQDNLSIRNIRNLAATKPHVNMPAPNKLPIHGKL